MRTFKSIFTLAILATLMPSAINAEDSIETISTHSIEKINLTNIEKTNQVNGFEQLNHIEIKTDTTSSSTPREVMVLGKLTNNENSNAKQFEERSLNKTVIMEPAQENTYIKASDNEDKTLPSISSPIATPNVDLQSVYNNVKVVDSIQEVKEDIPVSTIQPQSTAFADSQTTSEAKSRSIEIATSSNEESASNGQETGKEIDTALSISKELGITPDDSVLVVRDTPSVDMKSNNTQENSVLSSQQDENEINNIEQSTNQPTQSLEASPTSTPTFKKEDYQPLVEAGINNCGDGTELTIDGCACAVGYEGDPYSEAGCAEIPEPTPDPVILNDQTETTENYDNGTTQIYNSYGNVTTDTGGLWTGNAIADTALSLVGSTGYWCNDVVNAGLSAIGWGAGTWTNGTQVSLSELQPGDIIVYPSHYSVYVGNGRAVHGGYSGLNVVLGDIVVGKQPYTAYRCE